MLGLALLLSVEMTGDPPQEDWWHVPFTGYGGAVEQLYVDRHGIASDLDIKTFWISESLDDTSPLARKLEQVSVDCAVPRYRGLLWRWIDHEGRRTASDESDERWNVVTAGSPMDAARTFVCTSPPDGSVQVPSVPE